MFKRSDPTLSNQSFRLLDMSDYELQVCGIMIARTRPTPIPLLHQRRKQIPLRNLMPNFPAHLIDVVFAVSTSYVLSSGKFLSFRYISEE